MGAWLVSIAAVVALSVLLDIIVPEGETNKYIKGIFAIITVFVIITPIAKLIKSELKFEDFFGGVGGDLYIETSIVNQTRDDLNRITETSLEKTLQDLGYKNVIARIYLNYERKIDFVTIDINNLIIDGNISHINITNDITGIVSQCLRIDKERIIIYGSYTG